MDYFWSLIVTSVLGLALIVHLYSKWRLSYWTRKGVTQLEPKFFYGDIKQMAKGEKSLAETYLDFYKVFKSLNVKFGGIYFIYRATLVVIDPKLVRTIMQKDFEYFTAHFPKRGVPSIFTNSIFHLEGEPWRHTRKKLTPTFTSGKMRMMFETLREKSSGLQELAGEVATLGEAVNIKDVLERFTTDVIGSCGFGLECNSLKDPDSEFLKNGKLIFTPPEKKENYWGLLLRALGVVRRRQDFSSVDKFFKNVVAQTIDYREKNKIVRKDFMHLMIQLKNRGVVTDDENIFDKVDKPIGDTFTEDDITAQCLLFFIAGFETSATTMTFALLELAQNQDVQDKVREEANEIFKKYDEKITYEAVMDLSYTEKVIQETLRKYPPVAVIPRVCTKTYTIPGTDIVIEKGTVTNIPAWGLQMDPEYFPDPEKFDPERFNKENKEKIVDFTYLPFGEGPRMCLGLRFGMMQSKVGIIMLIRHFKFTLNKKTSLPLKMRRDAFITTVDGAVWLDIAKI